MVPSGIFPPQGGNCSYSFGGGRQDDGRFLLLYTIGRAERRLLGYCYCNEYLLNSNYSLEFTQCSGYSLKHTSLKRLGPSGWLNDEVVNGFNMHFLRPKLDGSSFIYVSQLMSQWTRTCLLFMRFTIRAPAHGDCVSTEARRGCELQRQSIDCRT